MKHSVLLSLVLAGGAATGALAGNTEPATIEPVIAAPVAPAAPVTGNWEGGYVGGQLGYGFGEFDVTPPNTFDTDGVIGGFHVGYLWDFGDWVVGPELQYDWSDLSFNSGGNSGSFDGIARLKVRGGRDLGDGLLYASAGVAYTNFDGVSGVTNIDFDDPGYVVGVGYDYKVSEDWVVGGEYQYHKFDDFGAAGNDVDFGTVHLRASYKF